MTSATFGEESLLFLNPDACCHEGFGFAGSLAAQLRDSLSLCMCASVLFEARAIAVPTRGVMKDGISKALKRPLWDAKSSYATHTKGARERAQVQRSAANGPSQASGGPLRRPGGRLRGPLQQPLKTATPTPWQLTSPEPMAAALPAAGDVVKKRSSEVTLCIAKISTTSALTCSCIAQLSAGFRETIEKNENEIEAITR